MWQGATGTPASIPSQLCSAGWNLSNVGRKDCESWAPGNNDMWPPPLPTSQCATTAEQYGANVHPEGCPPHFIPQPTSLTSRWQPGITHSEIAGSTSWRQAAGKLRDDVWRIREVPPSSRVQPSRTQGPQKQGGGSPRQRDQAWNPPQNFPTSQQLTAPTPTKQLAPCLNQVERNWAQNSKVMRARGEKENVPIMPKPRDSMLGVSKEAWQEPPPLPSPPVGKLRDRRAGGADVGECIVSEEKDDSPAPLPLITELAEHVKYRKTEEENLNLYSMEVESLHNKNIEHLSLEVEAAAEMGLASSFFGTNNVAAPDRNRANSRCSSAKNESETSVPRSELDDALPQRKDAIQHLVDGPTGSLELGDDGNDFVDRFNVRAQHVDELQKLPEQEELLKKREEALKKREEALNLMLAKHAIAAETGERANSCEQTSILHVSCQEQSSEFAAPSSSSQQGSNPNAIGGVRLNAVRSQLSKLMEMLQPAGTVTTHEQLKEVLLELMDVSEDTKALREQFRKFEELLSNAVQNEGSRSVAYQSESVQTMLSVTSAEDMDANLAEPAMLNMVSTVPLAPEEYQKTQRRQSSLQQAQALATQAIVAAVATAVDTARLQQEGDQISNEQVEHVRSSLQLAKLAIANAVATAAKAASQYDQEACRGADRQHRKHHARSSLEAAKEATSLAVAQATASATNKVSVEGQRCQEEQVQELLKVAQAAAAGAVVAVVSAAADDAVVDTGGSMAPGGEIDSEMLQRAQAAAAQEVVDAVAATCPVAAAVPSDDEAIPISAPRQGLEELRELHAEQFRQMKVQFALDTQQQQVEFERCMQEQREQLEQHHWQKLQETTLQLHEQTQLRKENEATMQQQLRVLQNELHSQQAKIRELTRALEGTSSLERRSPGDATQTKRDTDRNTASTVRQQRSVDDNPSAHGNSDCVKNSDSGNIGIPAKRGSQQPSRPSQLSASVARAASDGAVFDKKNSRCLKIPVIDVPTKRLTQLCEKGEFINEQEEPRAPHPFSALAEASVNGSLATKLDKKEELSAAGKDDATRQPCVQQSTREGVDGATACFHRPCAKKLLLNRKEGCLAPASPQQKFHSVVRWGKPIEDIENVLKANGLMIDAAVEEEDPKNGNRALHIAAQNGHVDLARYLLSHSADVNAPNKKGQTPLHMSVEYDFYFQTKVLLDAGADKERTNNDGHKAILGIDGAKVGQDSWDNPMNKLKAAGDNADELEEAFTALETCDSGMISISALAQAGMQRKKACRQHWDQERFVKIMHNLQKDPLANQAEQKIDAQEEEPSMHTATEEKLQESEQKHHQKIQDLTRVTAAKPQMDRTVKKMAEDLAESREEKKRMELRLGELCEKLQNAMQAQGRLEDMDQKHQQMAENLIRLQEEKRQMDQTRGKMADDLAQSRKEQERMELRLGELCAKLEKAEQAQDQLEEMDQKRQQLAEFLFRAQEENKQMDQTKRELIESLSEVHDEKKQMEQKLSEMADKLLEAQRAQDLNQLANQTSIVTEGNYADTADTIPLEAAKTKSPRGFTAADYCHSWLNYHECKTASAPGSRSHSPRGNTPITTPRSSPLTGEFMGNARSRSPTPSGVVARMCSRREAEERERLQRDNEKMREELARLRQRLADTEKKQEQKRMEIDPVQAEVPPACGVMVTNMPPHQGEQKVQDETYQQQCASDVSQRCVIPCGENGPTLQWRTSSSLLIEPDESSSADLVLSTGDQAAQPHLLDVSQTTNTNGRKNKVLHSTFSSDESERPKRQTSKRLSAQQEYSMIGSTFSHEKGSPPRKRWSDASNTSSIHVLAVDEPSLHAPMVDAMSTALDVFLEKTPSFSPSSPMDVVETQALETVSLEKTPSFSPPSLADVAETQLPGDLHTSGKGEGKGPGIMKRLVGAAVMRGRVHTADHHSPQEGHWQSPWKGKLQSATRSSMVA